MLAARAAVAGDGATCSDLNFPRPARVEAEVSGLMLLTVLDAAAVTFSTATPLVLRRIAAAVAARSVAAEGDFFPRGDADVEEEDWGGRGGAATTCDSSRMAGGGGLAADLERPGVPRRRRGSPGVVGAEAPRVAGVSR